MIILLYIAEAFWAVCGVLALANGDNLYAIIFGMGVVFAFALASILEEIKKIGCLK